MPDYLLILAPSANRVYTAATPALAAAELAVTVPQATQIEQVQVAGMACLAFTVEQLGDTLARQLAHQSSALGLFRRVTGDLLQPVTLPGVRVLDDDLVTIPKYPGKTNELFTRLLCNVTTSQVATGRTRLEILDPLAGRGTTLLVAWLTGHDGFGVELDARAFDAMAAYLKTYLRRKRLKHACEVTPVRREGRLIGRRLDARLTREPALTLTVFTGDCRDSAKLYGRKAFDAIITDAPYGVVHTARQDRRRDHSPAALLAEAIPVWAGQLRPGGAMGISWNSHGLSRTELQGMLTGSGLRVCSGGGWENFAHQVDAGILRDLIVATKPGAQGPASTSSISPSPMP